MADRALNPMSLENENVSEKLGTLNLVDDCESKTMVNGYYSASGNSNVEDDDFYCRWGFGLAKLYKLAVQFVKGIAINQLPTSNLNIRHMF